MAEEVKAKKRPKCKVSDCPRYRRMEGFCDICYGRYKKGFYNINGEKSYKAAKKEQALKAKRNKRVAKAEHKKWVERKEKLAAQLNSRHLKVLQEKFPESRRSWYCKPLEFQTCDAMCYGRMFIHSKDRFPTCHSCHIHDSNFDFLEKFLEESEQNDT